MFGCGIKKHRTGRLDPLPHGIPSPPPPPRLPRLDLASGEFPQPRQRHTFRPLTNEETPFMLHNGNRDAGRHSFTSSTDPTSAPATPSRYTRINMHNLRRDPIRHRRQQPRPDTAHFICVTFRAIGATRHTNLPSLRTGLPSWPASSVARRSAPLTRTPFGLKSNAAILHASIQSRLAHAHDCCSPAQSAHREIRQR